MVSYFPDADTLADKDRAANVVCHVALSTPLLPLTAHGIGPLWLPVQCFPGGCFRSDLLATTHDIKTVNFEIRIAYA
jgi:hypothetical protein